MADVVVTGAEDLASLARALKQVGRKDLSRKLSRGITKGLKPAKQAVLSSALTTLPKRGGLNVRVARQMAIRTTRRNGVRTQGVRLTGRHDYHLIQMDKGKLRHPVFNTGDWVSQDITPGFFTKPLEALKPELQRAVLAAANEIAREIERSVNVHV